MSLPWPRIVVLTLTVAITGRLAAHMEQKSPQLRRVSDGYLQNPGREQQLHYGLHLAGGSTDLNWLGDQSDRHEPASLSTRWRRRAESGRYSLTLVNLYNQDYPDFGYPEATLSVHFP